MIVGSLRGFAILEMATAVCHVTEKAARRGELHVRPTSFRKHDAGCDFFHVGY